MRFGQRKADAPERGGGVYLRRFKKGETKLRFLEEPDEWIEFWEHFTPDKRGFPCTQDKETCPGCTSTNEDVARAGRKYAAYVYLPKMDKVLPFAMPVTLADSFERRYERNKDENDRNTLTNRDYVVIRTGDGFETKYDVDQEDRYPVDLEALRKQIPYTIEECLEAAYEEVWGRDEEAKPATAKGVEHTPGDPNPPTEPTGQGQAESEVLTEAKIRQMDKTELRALCDKGGVAWDEADTRSELIERLLEEFGD